MMNTVNALQDLYVALGGEESEVADCTQIVEVLNAISEKYEGEGNASLNPVAIENIAAVADNIGMKPSGTITITENGTHDVTEYAEASVNVPSIATLGSVHLVVNVDSDSMVNAGYFNDTNSFIKGIVLTKTSEAGATPYVYEADVPCHFHWLANKPIGVFLIGTGSQKNYSVSQNKGDNGFAVATTPVSNIKIKNITAGYAVCVFYGVNSSSSAVTDFTVTVDITTPA